jgi:hypothetical protein
MITTAFAHGIERVTLTRAHNHLEIELYGPERTIRSASLTVFGDALVRTRPALTLDGVDPIASIDAARHALALLDDALVGNPVNVPHAVFEARDALARGLTVPTTTEGV